MLDWILVTVSPCCSPYLSRGLYGAEELFYNGFWRRVSSCSSPYFCLEECMEGRSCARLDSGDVSHPVPHYISV
jgi:hypothetical protein